MYRMQNTVDHTNVADLIQIVGATPAAHTGSDSGVPTNQS